MVRGGGKTTMRRVPDTTTTGGVCPSVSLTVKVNSPAVVGVPEIKPVLPFRVSPGGSAEPAGRLHT
jgi:hypothetical protein